MFRLARIRDPVDGKPGRTLEMTVYEAHYGEKPSFAALAIGPFGCLAFVVLTSEQRQARGFDKSWSPKAIAGMYMGIWHNARKGIFHYLMFDGSRILETTSNIRVIGDCLSTKQDDATPLDHPRDFKIQECPPIWRIAPGNDHEYHIAEAAS